MKIDQDYTIYDDGMDVELEAKPSVYQITVYHTKDFTDDATLLNYIGEMVSVTGAKCVVKRIG